MMIVSCVPNRPYDVKHPKAPVFRISYRNGGQQKGMNQCMLEGLGGNIGVSRPC